MVGAHLRPRTLTVGSSPIDVLHWRGRRSLGLALVSLAALLVTGCAAGGGGGGGPYPRFAEYEGREVGAVSFVGDLRLPEDSLRAVITTQASRCRLLFLPICVPFTDIGREEYELELDELANDVLRLQLYYRDHGYYGTRVVPSVDPSGDEVVVRFAVATGDQVILRDLGVEGTEEIIPPEEIVARLPLQEGQPFRRVGFLASADTVRSALLRRGHAYADVLRNYAIDTIADVAEAQFVALPGPLVYVDTILFEGAERLDERTLRQQITFDEGDLLNVTELNRSQRNIYDLQMVSFASVQLAPDSAQVDPDTAMATVLVRVVEAAQYVVEASAGFGTVDCIRSAGRWTNRNFIGGGRRLELIGSVSKIGVGAPLDADLEQSVCSETAIETFGQDTVREELDYRVAANFQQPRLFNTRNQLAVSLHSERQTELQAYLRESTGAQVSLVRNVDPQTILSTTLNVERGLTIASPVILCIGFDTCDAEDLTLLSEPRWSNFVSVGAVRDRTRTQGVITRGYVARASVDWASAVFNSDDRYLRVLTEGSVYRSVRPGWVLSGNLRVGRFLQGALGGEDGFIPPERRFYAGGPNTVRGYGRNALGPTAWVTTIDPETGGLSRDTLPSATGGTQMVVASVELRTPSPIFSDLTRFAAFVDAGQVSVPGTDLGTEALRFTPGVGLRLTTPVGPFRLDVAYNPYGREPGPLYLVDPVSGLTLLDERFVPESGSFWSRLRFSFAVGQAF